MTHRSLIPARQIIDSINDVEMRRDLHAEITAARHRVRFSIQQVADATSATVAQIRSWDALLLPTRARGSAEQIGTEHEGIGVHRRYDWAQLEKVLLITQFIKAGYSADAIAGLLTEYPDLADEVFAVTESDGISEERGDLDVDIHDLADTAEQALEELAGSHIAVRVLSIILALLLGTHATTEAYLIIPLRRSERQAIMHTSDNVARLLDLGPSVIAALRPAGTFTVFVHAHPRLIPERNYRLIPLSTAVKFETGGSVGETHDAGAEADGGAYLALPRRAVPPSWTLNVEGSASQRRLAAAIRLLSWLCATPLLDAVAHKPEGVSSLSEGDLSHMGRIATLRRFTDYIVSLGDTSSGGNGDLVEGWHFAVLLVPHDSRPARQHQRLVILSQSARSRHNPGDVRLTLGVEPGLSIRAYVNGSTAQRRRIALHDPTIANRDQEPTTRSAIAVPLEGEGGQQEGVLYVASEHEDAFNDEDVFALRLLGRVAAEIIASSRLSQSTLARLADASTRPHFVDPTIAGFQTEDHFLKDLDRFLSTYVGDSGMQHGVESVVEDVVPDTATQVATPDLSDPNETALALIAVDVDGTGSVAERLGEAAAANLTREIGERILSWILTQRSRPEHIGLYRVFADRFYLWLRDVPPEKVEALAVRLWRTLGMQYRITTRRDVEGESTSPALRVDPGSVTVRLGVNCYTHTDLRKLAGGDPNTTNLSMKVVSQLSEALKMGRHQGGNSIVVWDRSERRLKVLMRGGSGTETSDSLPQSSWTTAVNPTLTDGSLPPVIGTTNP